LQTILLLLILHKSNQKAKGDKMPYSKPDSHSKSYFIADEICQLSNGKKITHENVDSYKRWLKEHGLLFKLCEVETGLFPALIAVDLSSEELLSARHLIGYMQSALKEAKHANEIPAEIQSYFINPKVVYSALTRTFTGLVSLGLSKSDQKSRTKAILEACIQYLNSQHAGGLIQGMPTNRLLRSTVEDEKESADDYFQAFKTMYDFLYPYTLQMNSPPHFSLFHLMLSSSKKKQETLKLALKHIVTHRDADYPTLNLNAVEGKHQGNILHNAIANEDAPTARRLIDIFEELRAEGIEPFDYAQNDAEGKTILSIAAKSRLPLVVQRLMELKRQGIDIGFEVPDNEGRSPLLIAAALGQDKIVETLLENGANLDAIDNYGRGIDFYMQAPPLEVAAILHSIFTRPERSINSMHSYLESLPRRHVYVRSSETGRPIVISNDNIGLLIKIRGELSENEMALTDYIDGLLVNVLCGPRIEPECKSVIDACLEGQSKVQEVIKKYLEKNYPEEANKLFVNLTEYRPPFISVNQHSLLSSTRPGALLTVSPLITAGSSDTESSRSAMNLSVSFAAFITALLAVFLTAALMRRVVPKNPRNAQTFRVAMGEQTVRESVQEASF
jgi:hypothetical protein